MAAQTFVTRGAWRAASALRTADWLCLAATPTFAAMAVLTGLSDGGAQDMLCAAGQGASPLGGMAWMYLLMSAFHSAPWLKLIFTSSAIGMRAKNSV